MKSLLTSGVKPFHASATRRITSCFLVATPEVNCCCVASEKHWNAVRAGIGSVFWQLTTFSYCALRQSWHDNEYGCDAFMLARVQLAVPILHFTHCRKESNHWINSHLPFEMPWLSTICCLVHCCCCLCMTSVSQWACIAIVWHFASQSWKELSVGTQVPIVPHC